MELVSKFIKNLGLLGLVLFVLLGCSAEEGAGPSLIEEAQDLTQDLSQPSEDTPYYSKENVSAYIHTYKRLPDNYITKDQARDMGWEPNDKSGMVVGGDRFSNREGLLPSSQGRVYYEADLSEGYSTHRGPARLVYSNDGLIFYTKDHYNTFERLY